MDCSLTVGARRCPPNQTLNGAGEATDEKELRFAQPDPFSPQERSPTDPDVYVVHWNSEAVCFTLTAGVRVGRSQALREHLRENNGIRGLEVCEPHELDRIHYIYTRDGFGEHPRKAFPAVRNQHTRILL